jgi:AraC-like DNA-binding protein/mannose-6-phosphate isomerase-like protein (cupin superfamily)
MGILNIDEHLNCFHYDKTENPQIELVNLPKGFEKARKANNNEVIFFMSGKMKYHFLTFSDVFLSKGQILFIPAGESFSYKTVSNVTLIIFRLHDHIQLCENFQIEKLYGIRQTEPGNDYEPRTKSMNLLEIKPGVWHFLDSLANYLNDGVKCRCFFEIKVKEFFSLLRLYYPKEDIHDFFYLILSGDTAFSEYVRQRWMRFRNVKEMADSVYMTQKHFSEKFKNIFGMTPHKWMEEGRANMMLNELTSTNKSFKQIASEMGFSSEQQFSKFSRRVFGKTARELRMSAKTCDEK